MALVLNIVRYKIVINKVIITVTIHIQYINYKMVTTNTFNCHGTIELMYCLLTIVSNNKTQKTRFFWIFFSGAQVQGRAQKPKEEIVIFHEHVKRPAGEGKL